MRKSVLISVIAILSCSIIAAFAGVGTPIFITDGRIDEATLPIITHADLFKEGVPEIYCVDDSSAGVVGYRGGFRIDPHSWSSQPVQDGKVPTIEDRLLNPGKPITVFVFGCGKYNELSLNLDFYQDNGYGRLAMRVLDSTGKPLASVNNKNNPYNKPAVVAVNMSQEPEVFYLELSDPIKQTNRYCYIALNVKVLDSSSRMSREAIEAYTALMNFKQKYAQEHNITDRGKLTIQDFTVIFDQVNQTLGYFAFDISKLKEEYEEVDDSSKNDNNTTKKTTKSTKTKKSTTTKKGKRTSK